MKDFLKGVFWVIFIVACVYGFILGFAWLLVANDGGGLVTLKQGEAVTVLSNVTEVRGGQACQIVENANIAYTGENDLSWRRFTPKTLAFPRLYYHVIKSDGTLIWVDSSHVEKFDLYKSFCSPLP